MQAIQDPQAAQYDQGPKLKATVGIMWKGGGDSHPQQPDDVTLTIVGIRHLRWDQIGGCCIMVLSRVRPEPLLGHLKHLDSTHGCSLSPLEKQDTHCWQKE